MLTPDNPIKRRQTALKRLDGMWSHPGVPQEWQMPKGVDIGIASHNPGKIREASQVLLGFGGLPAYSDAPLEQAIKTIVSREQKRSDRLRKWSLGEEGRVQQIVKMKARFTFAPDSPVTHGFALDTDTSVSGTRLKKLLGVPHNTVELLLMLFQTSGKHIHIETAAALADLGRLPTADIHRQRVVALDSVTMLLKVRRLSFQDMWEAIRSGVAGRFSGGINYANIGAIPLLDQRMKVHVNRTYYGMRESPKTLWRKTAEVDAWDAPILLGDYFLGRPRELILSVIYQGIAHPVPHAIL